AIALLRARSRGSRAFGGALAPGQGDACHQRPYEEQHGGELTRAPLGVAIPTSDSAAIASAEYRSHPVTGASTRKPAAIPQLTTKRPDWRSNSATSVCPPIPWPARYSSTSPTTRLTSVTAA